MRLLISAIWVIAFCMPVAILSGNYVESLYAARVASGGDPAFGDLGFNWAIGNIALGIIVFTVGLTGKLPGTKRI